MLSMLNNIALVAANAQKKEKKNYKTLQRGCMSASTRGTHTGDRRSKFIRGAHAPVAQREMDGWMDAACRRCILPSECMLSCMRLLCGNAHFTVSIVSIAL